MTREIQEYRKIFTRFYSLVSYECWYQGERFGLLEIGNKKVFFEVIFSYKKRQGTEVYYNFTDLKQSPLPLVWYFEDNLDEFKKIINEYKINCRLLIEIRSDSRMSDKEKLKEIYSVYQKLMPVVTATMLIGFNDEEVKNRELAKISYEARRATEDFIFYTTEGIIETMRKIVPEEYKDYLFFLTYDEAMGKLPTVSILKERQESYIYYQGEVFSGVNKEEFGKKYGIKFIKEEPDSLGEGGVIQGRVAFVGKIIGRVKRITDVSDMKNIKENEILVTSMTTPDLISAMKKAAAFVTDEGGITCHAAIVAREMKKPCIIGTKIATQVLKDGDLVEVNADKGVVRILRKNEKA